LQKLNPVILCVLLRAALIQRDIRHIRDIYAVRAHHERLWHIVGNADNAAALLTGVEEIRRRAADGAFLYVENADHVVLFHRGIPTQEQIHRVTPP